MAITHAEFGKIRGWGRALAANGDESAAFRAAEWIVIADPQEAQSLRWEFLEGVRNYALNMDHYFQCMDALEAKVSEIRA